MTSHSRAIVRKLRKGVKNIYAPDIVQTDLNGILCEING